MNNKKTKSKFHRLNFNLKNEIFSFLYLRESVNNVFPLAKNFMKAFYNFKIFKLIKANFDNFVSQATYDYSEMEIIKESFMIDGLSELSAFDACVYLSSMKIRKLKKLEISIAKLFEKEKEKFYFRQIILFNKSIETLVLNLDYLLNKDKNDIICFLQELKNICSIKTIKFEFNLKDSRKIDLCTLLISKEIIQSLKLDFEDFLEKNLIDSYILFEELAKNKSIKKLKISNIHSFLMKLLLEVILKNESIKNLNLSHNSLGEKFNDKQLVNLLESLKKNTSINKLNLSNNLLSCNLSFCEMIKFNNSITDLNLSFNEFGVSNENSHNYFMALKENTSINKLNLSNNDLKFNDSFYEMIKFNKSITDLNLSCNNFGISEENINNLFMALIMNTSIKKLNLSQNKLGLLENSMYLITEALKINGSIKNCNLQLNDFGEYLKETDRLEFRKLIFEINLIWNNLELDNKELNNLNENKFMTKKKKIYKILCKLRKLRKKIKLINYFNKYLCFNDKNLFYLEKFEYSHYFLFNYDQTITDNFIDMAEAYATYKYSKNNNLSKYKSKDEILNEFLYRKISHEKINSNQNCFYPKPKTLFSFSIFYLLHFKKDFEFFNDKFEDKIGCYQNILKEFDSLKLFFCKNYELVKDFNKCGNCIEYAKNIKYELMLLEKKFKLNHYNTYLI